MSKPTYLTHVTLTTGHVAVQQRAKMPDHAVAAAGRWLSEALVHDGARPVALPEPVADPAYSGVALSSPGGVAVTIMGHHTGHDERVPIVTIGMARRPRNARKIWDQLCGAAGVRPCEPPPAPWVAVLVYDTMAAFCDAAAWLGGLEAALGWAYYDGVD